MNNPRPESKLGNRGGSNIFHYQVYDFDVLHNCIDIR